MSVELKLSAQDRAWLRAIDEAMQSPLPVVPASVYQAVVESRDAAVSRIHLMRANRRRMWARYRRLRGWLFKFELAAVAIIGALILWKA